MKKILATTILLLSSFSLFASDIDVEKFSKKRCSEIAPLLKEGDILFVEIQNKLYRNVASAMGGWMSHVGVAFKKRWNKKKWQVYESTVPLTRRTNLCKFLKKSKGGKISVVRLKDRDLSEKDIKKMLKYARRKLFLPYHLGFDFDSKRTMFCSKYVNYIYKKALDIELGYPETFKKLLGDNPDLDLKFWEKWFRGNIPYERRTLTPKTVYDDPKLTEIYYYESNESMN